MKVSIITSCYNRVKTIRDAIESVLAQTYPDIEYIVVDGGSTDGSREMIESYRDHITKIIFKADSGMYEGINNGIREATGDIIALCHSDDQLYDKHTVEKIVREFEKNNAVELVYADGIFSNEQGKTVRVWQGKTFRHWKVRCGWLPLHTTCYAKREIFDKYGLYDESYRIAADTKFLLSLFFTHNITTAYLPQMVVNMRMGGASTDKGKRKAMWHEDIRVFREAGFRFPVVMKFLKMMWKPSQFVKAALLAPKSNDQKEDKNDPT